MGDTELTPSDATPAWMDIDETATQLEQAAGMIQVLAERLDNMDTATANAAWGALTIIGSVETKLSAIVKRERKPAA